MEGMTVTSKIDGESAVRRYWKAAGWTIIKEMRAGIVVERPDFWVVRVSIAGKSQKQITKLCQLIEGAKNMPFSAQATHLASRVQQRFSARGVGRALKQYVNLVGDTKVTEKGKARLNKVTKWLAEQGVGDVTLVPGPMLLSTTGGRHEHTKVTCMPLNAATAATFSVELLHDAAKHMARDLAGQDPHLDVEAGCEPKWTSHSLRRCAATAARRHLKDSGMTEVDIDIFMGWNERLLMKAMQRHYEAMNVRSRMRLAKTTAWM